MPSTAATETTAAQKCSKCGEVGDVAASPKWCKACRAKYQREYEATKKEMQESRGYAAGMTAMRAYLAGEFERRYGSSGHFSGNEIGHIIRTDQGQPR